MSPGHHIFLMDVGKNQTWLDYGQDAHAFRPCGCCLFCLRASLYNICHNCIALLTEWPIFCRWYFQVHFQKKIGIWFLLSMNFVPNDKLIHTCITNFQWVKRIISYNLTDALSALTHVTTSLQREWGHVFHNSPLVRHSRLLTEWMYKRGSFHQFIPLILVYYLL